MPPHPLPLTLPTFLLPFSYHILQLSTPFDETFDLSSPLSPSLTLTMSAFACLHFTVLQGLFTNPGYQWHCQPASTVPMPMVSPSSKMTSSRYLTVKSFYSSLHAIPLPLLDSFFIKLRQSSAPIPLCPSYYLQLHASLQRTAAHCTALHCTVLYCTVLYCTVLYCTVPHHVFDDSISASP